MKKLSKLVAIAAIVATCAMAGSASAATTADHKGMFLGGGLFAGGESGPLDRFGGGAGARVGYGMNDTVLVYLDNNYFYTRKTGTNFNFFDTQAKVQWFPHGGWYVAGGGGLAVGQVNNSGASNTEAGFTTGTNAGYEFRPKDNLAVSVETGFNYKRLGGTNFYTSTAGGRVDWYF